MDEEALRIIKQALEDMIEALRELNTGLEEAWD